MKNYVHARLDPEERKILMELKKKTGDTESALVKRGLRLIYQEVKKKKNALELLGKRVGMVSSGVKDLSTNKKHMEGFGK